MPLPAPFDSEYRVATDAEIHSWSFGQIAKPRVSHSTSLEDHIATLNDQRIFGPLESFRCGCGQYDGSQYDGLVCDRCGVKVTTTDARKTRFGHIDFGLGTVEHPFDATASMGCFPVIPAVYLESSAGTALCSRYDQLLAGSGSLTPIIEYLRPSAEQALHWQTADADIFTRGLGLIRHADAS